MTWQLIFLRLLFCWTLAAVAAAHDVWRADARGASAAHSFLSAVRICVRYGVVLTIGVIFEAMFESIDRIWDFSLKPLSYDLTAYREYVRQAVLVGFGLCFIIVISLVDRPLDRLLPNDLANRTRAADR